MLADRRLLASDGAAVTDDNRPALVNLRLLAAGAAGAAGIAAGRRRYLRWGATAEEVHAALPGDDLLARVNLSATRAITIRAGAEQVWPWLAQLGQARGGFYSYDFLENLVGCHITSAECIVPQWQAVAVGDTVHLHPEIGLTVALAELEEALVWRGGVPMGRTPPPYDFTWAFVLRAGPAGSIRLVVREHYAYLRRWAPLVVEPVELISALMSQKMLRGIRDRAERVVGSASGAGA